MFGYLHPFDVWSLRRTCRRWNEQLSSAQLMRDSVNRFATEHPSDSALDKDANTPQSLALGLRHVLALRLARPFTYVSLPDTLGTLHSTKLSRQEKLSRFRLKGKHIAYFQDKSVFFRDLISGQTALLCGEAREVIMDVTLSTELVAFTTYAGILYVARLKDLTAPPSPVRLPSSNLSLITAEGGIIGCIFTGSELLVIIYNAASRKSTSFNLRAVQDLERQTNPGTHLRVCAMSINEDRETIDIAAVVSPTGREMNEDIKLRVVVLRFSFAGEYIMQVAWEQQMPGLGRYCERLGPFKATGEKGIHSMRLNCYYSQYQPYQPYQPGMFDVREANTVASAPRKISHAELTLLFDDVEFSLKSVDPKILALAYYPTPGPVRAPLYWKDRLYGTGSHTGPMADFLAASRSGTPHGPSYDGPNTLQRLDGAPISDVDEGRLESEMNDEAPYVVSRFWPRSVQNQPTGGKGGRHEAAMNESFIVIVSTDLIEVACFDERIKMHGAASTKLWEHGAKSGMRRDKEVSYILPSSV